MKSKLIFQLQMYLAKCIYHVTYIDVFEIKTANEKKETLTHVEPAKGKL